VLHRPPGESAPGCGLGAATEVVAGVVPVVTAVVPVERVSAVEVPAVTVVRTMVGRRLLEAVVRPVRDEVRAVDVAGLVLAVAVAVPDGVTVTVRVDVTGGSEVLVRVSSTGTAPAAGPVSAAADPASPDSPDTSTSAGSDASVLSPATVPVTAGDDGVGSRSARCCIPVWITSPTSTPRVRLSTTAATVRPMRRCIRTSLRPIGAPLGA
jgi:hypothetical protein